MKRPSEWGREVGANREVALSGRRLPRPLLCSPVQLRIGRPRPDLGLVHQGLFCRRKARPIR